MKRNYSAWLMAAGLCLSACGGSGSDSGLEPIVSTETSPQFISYPDPNTFVQGVPITPLVPQITGGTPSNYIVEPSLPAGLRIDGQGRILGTPTERAAPTSYLVTALNTAGSTSFSVRITVEGRYTIGGVVFGLTGTGLVVTNNGGNPLAITADGRFTFDGVFRPGDVVNVIVATQPAGQSCGVSGGTGLVSNANFGDAVVTCTANVNKAVWTGGTLNDLARERTNDSRGLQYTACALPAEIEAQLAELVEELAGHPCESIYFARDPVSGNITVFFTGTSDQSF